jgi:hypothetical protein
MVNLLDYTELDYQHEGTKHIILLRISTGSVFGRFDRVDLWSKWSFGTKNVVRYNRVSI